jgi:hypothetical protein
MQVLGLQLRMSSYILDCVNLVSVLLSIGEEICTYSLK